MRTGAGLLAEKQQDRLEVLLAADAHVEVEVTWSIHQRMIYYEIGRASCRERV